MTIQLKNKNKNVSLALLCHCTCLHGLSASHVVRVVEVRHPGLGSMAHAYFHFVGASQLFKLLLQVIHNLKKDKTKKVGQV